MGKFTSDELAKTIKAALADDSPKNDDKTDAVAGLSKKFDSLVDVISKMIPAGEKPKSIEDIVAEAVAKAVAAVNPPKQADKKIADLTTTEFADIFGKAIASHLGKVIKADKPKGKGKSDEVLDEIGKALGIDEDEETDDEPDEKVDEKDDEPDEKPAKKGKELKVDTVEKTDAQGNDIPLEKRVKMQALDDFMGKELNKRYSNLKKDAD